MIRTGVYLRPDARQADLVRIGSLYLSRTSDRKAIYAMFVPEPDARSAAESSTTSKALLRLVTNFNEWLGTIIPATKFAVLNLEEDVVEAIFRLLPTNLKHDEISEYPAEDFFVKVIREQDESVLRKGIFEVSCP